MKKNIIETLVGFFVLIIAMIFFVIVYTKSSFSQNSSGYHLVTNFQSIDGIAQDADVKISGIQIGYVKKLVLEDDYYVTVTLSINDGINIPKDSMAIVSSNGLLGSKYIRINPGGSDDMLDDGGKIKFTQSSLNIEDLISKLVYSLSK